MSCLITSNFIKNGIINMNTKSKFKIISKIHHTESIKYTELKIEAKAIGVNNVRKPEQP